jgi:hypothetical protein
VSHKKKKRCPRCGCEDITQFGKSTRRAGGLESYCNKCKGELDVIRRSKKTTPFFEKEQKNRKARVKRSRQWLFDYYKIHPCVDCSETDPIVLEMDHIDASTKGANISQLACNGASIVRMETEVAKCEVRCCNCHRRRTAKQFGYYQDLD